MFEVFSPYIAPIEKHLDYLLSSLNKSVLQETSTYALKNGGKRIRPALVLIVSEALGNDIKPLNAACATEYFHTASLIADDLPCMDDAQQRRNKPALHIAYNEATAILTTYALISEGYDLIRKESQGKAPLLFHHAMESATFNTGIDGATGGQYLDLYPGTMTEAKANDLMRKKTGTLFELSFVFGWLFGGGDISQLQTVKEIAHHFGAAFQLLDDLDDLDEDRALNKMSNYALLCGVERTRERVERELGLLREKLERLGIAQHPVFEHLLMTITL